MCESSPDRGGEEKRRQSVPRVLSLTVIICSGPHSNVADKAPFPVISGSDCSITTKNFPDRTVSNKQNKTAKQLFAILLFYRNILWKV
jgi:hypothetical protein